MSWLRFAVTLMVLGIASSAAAQVPRPARKGVKQDVTIDSSPQQAAIYLDDKKFGIVGYTPYTGKLVRGEWTLILELPGYRPVSQKITIGAKAHEFFQPLEKGNGTIDVQTAGDPNVAGATLYIDGEAKGTVPNSADVAEGRHLVELKKPSFGDFAQWVTLKAGERVTLTPILKGNTKGSLLVDADVPAAWVSVDGKRLDDTTPAIVDALDAGPHVVEVGKDAGQTWKQTITVKAGARTKVAAELRGLAGGVVRVLANVEDAEIFIDGTSRGKAPLEVASLAPGTHIFEAKAKGFADKDLSVKVDPGQQQVVKIDLVQGVSGPSGTVKITAPAPDSTVFIDGTAVGATPWQGSVSAGEHTVVVEHEGFGRFERKITVGQGATENVTAELSAIGGVRFLSLPEGATVAIDGVPAGKTPLVKTDVPVGQHVIAFRADGYLELQQPITVQTGQTAVLSGTLHAQNELTPEQANAVRRGLVSYGASIVPIGRVTLDASAGYPYWTELRATTGMVDGDLAADVAISFRTLLQTWEFLGTARLRLARAAPFAAAGFATIGGGGGASGRNQFTLQTGVVGSILFANVVTVSARLFLDIWSDRLCDKDDAGVAQGSDVCTGKASAADIAKAKSIHGSDDLFSRDSGARIYTSMIAELSLREWLSLFVVFEGTPFQRQRAAFTNLFTSTLLSSSDPIYNIRAGFTFKF